LLNALVICETSLGGAGERFVKELAEIRYVPAGENRKEWQRGFEQLIQKFSEILVARVLFEAPWPAETRFSLEPLNPTTGARPEILVETPAQQWLFEVKCPAFIDYQERRAAQAQQLPVRGPLGSIPDIRGSATLPRDNVFKDFLESAEIKFTDFSEKPRTGILVVLWDGYIYEATAALSHQEAGLLTAKSWHVRDGNRVPFGAVDGVLILNHLEILKLGAQERPFRREDAFTIGGEGQPPNVWCPNLDRGELDQFVAKLFDAWPLEAVSNAADYSPKDYVMWIG
jgi:hypothetical protein